MPHDTITDPHAARHAEVTEALNRVNGHNPKGDDSADETADGKGAPKTPIDGADVERFEKKLRAHGVREPELAGFRKIAEGNLTPNDAYPGTDVATVDLLRRTCSAPLVQMAEDNKWYWYDGTRFSIDDMHNMQRRVGALGYALRERAFALQGLHAKAKAENPESDPPDYHTPISKWAKRLQGEGGTNATLNHAAHYSRRRVCEFDRDKFVLNVQNGTIDLRTGKLRPHRPSDMLRKLANVKFDPNAKAPTFEAFMATILPDDKVRKFVLRYLGYSLTGDASEQMLMVALGDGSNGKGVLAELIRYIIGEYVGNLPITSLLVQSRNVENDLAGLVGTRFVTAKEAPEGKAFDEARLKEMTGEDTLSVRFLFKEFFDYKPEFKLFVYSNKLPVIEGMDNGIWRRLALVEFVVKFVKAPANPAERDPKAHYMDPKLGAKLRAESSGILNTLLAACKEWQDTGLDVPEAVINATKQWQTKSDVIADFVASRIEKVPHIKGAKTSVDAVFAAYVQWAKEQAPDRKPLAKNPLSTQLRRLGLEPDPGHAEGRFWKGVSLRKPEPED